MNGLNEVEEVAETGESTIELEETEIYLYSIELNLQTREFKGQTSGVTKTALQINCNSVADFKTNLWTKIRDKLKREVVFDDNNPRWHDNVLPLEEDMERFVLFYDAKSKRSVTLDKINQTTLQHWRTKEIWLYTHVYSMSIANLTLWKKVQKTLIEPMNRDRAGASTVAEMNALVGRLKDIHRLNYQSSQINWYMWANRIQASEPHSREKMIQKPPPPDMLHLFAVAKTSADQTISDVKQNLSVAESVNEGVTSGLSRIRILVDDIVKIQSGIADLRKEEQVKIELLNHELKNMEVQSSTTRTLITSMEQALPVNETDFGRQIFSKIQDQDDVDHMEVDAALVSEGN